MLQGWDGFRSGTVLDVYLPDRGPWRADLCAGAAVQERGEWQPVDDDADTFTVSLDDADNAARLLAVSERDVTAMRRHDLRELLRALPGSRVRFRLAEDAQGRQVICGLSRPDRQAQAEKHARPVKSEHRLL
jgi:hypothetical protein